MHFLKKSVNFTLFICKINLREEVSFNEIQILENFLLSNHKEEKIANLIIPLLYIGEIPHGIIAKFLLRVYTEETSFCYEMNRLLMKQVGNI